MADAVNAQITDAVTQSNTNVLGGSPAQSMGLVYQTMAHSISLTMQNAVSAQSGMQQINAAVIASACQKIMSLPTVVVAPSSAPVQVQPSPPAIPSPAPTTSSPEEKVETPVEKPQPEQPEQPGQPGQNGDDNDSEVDDKDIIDDELP